MKTKLIGLALFAATAAALAYYPIHQNGAILTPAPVDPGTVQLPPVDPTTNERPRVEVVFVLDTTGSMSGLIQAAKEKIWSIASTLASAQPAPEIRMGLVAYRDRGDAYVTRVVDLSSDLDSVYATLMDFQADGGGDGPESVNQALYDAVHRISWSQDPKTYKTVFLVGDAPPHMDYQDDVKYPVTLKVAKEQGILVNAVQCGRAGETTREWQSIAQIGKGQYFQVDQAGSAVAIATPFDARLAELSAKLDETRMYYGSEAEKAAKRQKLEATDKLNAGASVESRARRAAFNASEGGETSFLGEKELVDDVASGRVDLSKVDREALPVALQPMAPTEQKAAIAKTAERRNELQGEIRDLAGQRSEYLKKKLEETGGAKDSLDEKIYRTVREQAAAVGLSYESDAPAY